jgi:hypothetical protein
MPTLEQILKDVQALSITDQRLLAALINPPRPDRGDRGGAGNRIFRF